MSRSRTLLNIALTALAVLVAVGWTASALPLEKPAAPAAVAPGSEPKILHKVNPVYPESAKKEGVQGIFHIEIVLGADGAAKDARVIASAPNQERLGEVKKGTPGATEGDSRLAEAALAAVRQWRFEPVLRNGKPVEALMTVTINFKLDDKKPR